MQIFGNQFSPIQLPLGFSLSDSRVLCLPMRNYFRYLNRRSDLDMQRRFKARLLIPILL